MADEKNIHQGHRQRMHERVQAQGFDSLAEHEALEYLLYFTIARGDTNALAHALIHRFGSLSGVLGASEEELCTVRGIGPASARLLHLLPEISRYYLGSCVEKELAIKSTEQMGRFLQARFVGVQHERVLLVALDKQSRVRGTFWLKDGGRTAVSLEIKDVVEAAIRGGTDTVVLCHNHPNGLAFPSREDLLATENIVRALGMLKITLRDHIILTEQEYFSMREENRLPFYDFASGEMMRPYPLK